MKCTVEKSSTPLLPLEKAKVAVLSPTSAMIEFTPPSYDGRASVLLKFKGESTEREAVTSEVQQ